MMSLVKKLSVLYTSHMESLRKKLMVLDIKGSSANLYDPKIASFELQNEGEVLFCAGNLSKLAIEGFIASHNCNKYRESLELLQL